ncbi:unnamed protein product [Caenorhabditis angaria]|uniref:Uncharacterized protein n=1 Tax=Caenorhabditis angaria TaxID=860376 RepID=A0A9P1IFJ1_9PELO|nr:unnamed protein product [Caenorhabditis angaria]
MLVPKKVSFILESIDFPPENHQKIQVYLKIENYEWLKIGDFLGGSDLPIGVDFGVLVADTWQGAEIELKFQKDELDYFGVLNLDQNEKTLQISGIGQVFEFRNPKNVISFKCAILVENLTEDWRRRMRNSGRNVETQTKIGVLRDFGCQTSPSSCSSKSTETSGDFINLEDVEKVLEAKVAQRLQNLNLTAPNQDCHVEDPKPHAENLRKPEIPTNSYNFLPRWTQLKQLDQLIDEKSEILRELEKRIAIARKMEMVRDRRREETQTVREKREKEEDPTSKERRESTEKEETTDDESESESTEEEEIIDPFEAKT